MENSFIARRYLVTFCLVAMAVSMLSAQSGKPVPVTGLFESDDVFQLTLRGRLDELLNDRAGEPQYHPLVLSYISPDSSEVVLPVEVKARGNFRRLKGSCVYPPLLIRFPQDGPYLTSVFKEQNALKLVMPCNKDDVYIIREYLVYKTYQLFTPYSFRVRLVEIKLEDDQNKKPVAPFYGMLLEEEAQMAARNHAVSVERKLQPTQLQTDAFLTMTVFQYMIGNTDWSIQYLQNIKLLVTDASDVPIAVPYDFDHSGLVSAPYAKPPEELHMRSVQERRYRGYCVADMQEFEKTLAQFINLKKDIYDIYNGCILLDAKHHKSIIKYLDAFYETVENPKAWQKAFFYPCDPNGTGNVVVKGLE